MRERYRGEEKGGREGEGEGEGGASPVAFSCLRVSWPTKNASRSSFHLSFYPPLS